MTNRSRSRKQTPWDDQNKLTAAQEYLKMHYVARYEDRHPRLADAGKAAIINSYDPKQCPYCGSEKFIQKGYDAIGIKRYRCSCESILNRLKERFLIPEKSLSVNG